MVVKAISWARDSFSHKIIAQNTTSRYHPGYVDFKTLTLHPLTPVTPQRAALKCHATEMLRCIFLRVSLSNVTSHPQDDASLEPAKQRNDRERRNNARKCRIDHEY